MKLATNEPEAYLKTTRKAEFRSRMEAGGFNLVMDKSNTSYPSVSAS